MKDKRKPRAIHTIDETIIIENVNNLRGINDEEKEKRLKFSIRLNNLLEKKGISQKDFASDIDIADSSLSDYRRGLKKPNMTVLSKMANSLEVSTDYLAGLTELESINDNFKAIHRFTGLSDEALTNLKKIKELKSSPLSLKALDVLLSNDLSPQFFKYLGLYLFENFKSDDELLINVIGDKTGNSYGLSNNVINDAMFVRVQKMLMELKNNIDNEK